MTKAQAKSLAVRYHAYLDAVAREDDEGIVVWGPMLAEIQTATRLEMISAANIEGLVAAARRRSMKQAD